MTKTPDGPTWGDGTLHELTEAFKEGPEVITENYPSHEVYTIWRRKIDDYDPSVSMFFMCQNNPFNF